MYQDQLIRIFFFHFSFVFLEEWRIPKNAFNWPLVGMSSQKCKYLIDSNVGCAVCKELWTEKILRLSKSKLCWNCLLSCLFDWNAQQLRNGILLPKLFWPTLIKNCSSDQEKILKFKAEGRDFAKILRSLEQFIQTVKGNRMLF